MKKERINQLAAEYRNGSELALEEIFRLINPLIETASREIERFTDDVTKFDCRALLKVKKAVSDPRVSNVYGCIVKNLANEKSDFLKRRRRKAELTSIESHEGESDEDLGYQFKSAANTESDVLFKERVTLLAQGNPKRQIILEQWSKGAEDKSISELLAQLFGGKATSHRIFVQRFRTECRTRLATDF